MGQSKRTDSNQDYLDRIAELSFEGVDSTREKILEIRDFLSPWSHNIKLPHEVYTASCDAYYPSHREVMEVLNNRLNGSFHGKRILDIGCLEGYFSVECALQGAEVLGVDGKEINLKKCDFVRSVLDIPNLRFVKDDALQVTKEKYGTFDAVLALGLLYHLDDPFAFLANMHEVCEEFVLIDTLVATEQDPQVFGDGWKPNLSPLRSFSFEATDYPGKKYEEFSEGTSQSVKDLSPTASLNNEWAIWLTKKSLVHLLKNIGFKQVIEFLYSPDENIWWRSDARVLLMASTERPVWESRVFHG